MRSIRPTNIRCASECIARRIERELAIYRSFGDSGAITSGGQWIRLQATYRWRFSSLLTEWAERL